MELRIRNLFRPAAHFFALMCRRLNFSSRALSGFLYLLTFTTSVLFLILTSSPYSKSILALSIAFMFTTGFFDEVRREFILLKKDAGRKLVFDRYVDLVIIAAAGYYLNLGSYRSLYTVSSHLLFLGSALGLGVILLNHALETRTRGERSPGLEVPAERLFLLSAFAIAGYTHNSFEDFLLGGLLALGLLTYGTLGYTLARGKRDLFSAARVAGLMNLAANMYAKALRPVKTISGVLYRMVKQTPERVDVLVDEEKEGIQEYAYVSEPGQGYNYTVVVVDAATGEPISGAMVELTDLERNRTIAGQTGETGKCVFTEIAEGQYAVSIKAGGYIEEQYERYISIDSGEIFRVSKAALDLSVVVNDYESRNPIPNAAVSLSREGVETVERATDNLGVAYFDQLEPGRGELVVEARGYMGVSRRINLAAENVVSVTLKRQAFIKFEGPTLVEYERHDRLEGAVRDVITELTGRGRKVYLVSTGALLDACAGEEVTGVDFTSAMLENLEAFIEEMPSRSALLFEATTELIHRVGLEEALGFIEGAVRYGAEKELNIVVFINRGAHGEKITGMFEEYFLGIAEVEDRGLVEKSVGP